MSILHTIGHSTHTPQRFIELLAMHGVSAVADVRSAPYSKYNPQFNRENLRPLLHASQKEYVFLGRELGARPDDGTMMADGHVQFSLLAQSPGFQNGLKRLRQGMESFCIALLCAEKDPIVCHRMILVCRALRSGGIPIRHILADGSLESNQDAERRLMRELNISDNDLFATPEEQVQRAYDIQGKKIAYTETTDG